MTTPGTQPPPPGPVGTPVVSPAELLSTRVTYRTTHDAVVEVRGLAGSSTMSVWRLGDLVRSVQVDLDSGTHVSLGTLPPGGYGVELVQDGTVWRTALLVTDAPRTRLRYGFVVDFAPGRDVAPVLDSVRRLHLTAIQFYDWGYRHADLIGGGERYQDPLGQTISLDTVRRLVHGLTEVGADSLGYAAVYGVGAAEWPRWRHLALLTPAGLPYGLGAFLSLVDPGAEEWAAHFTADLAAAAEQVGFDGFHLDQYGYPKFAVRQDGMHVDVARSFDVVIRRARAAMPHSRLVFNNVNDFPTTQTAKSPQDAVYVEVWPPQTTLGSLAEVTTRARAAAPARPIVVAAYQHVYDQAPAEEADLATMLTTATLASHGATQLLVGEADRLLIDPYYVRNHRVAPSTAAMLRRWNDFLVEHDELLFDPAAIDVTASWAGSYNDDLDVSYADTPVTEAPAPGAVWRRVTQVGDHLVVHLINLTNQVDTLWDAARRPPADTGAGELRVRRVGPGLPRMQVADPERGSRLVDVEVYADANHARAGLPAPYVWQIVVIDLFVDRTTWRSARSSARPSRVPETPAQSRV